MDEEEEIERCGCGLWLCPECRPENFDPSHPLNDPRRAERIAEIEKAVRMAERIESDSEVLDRLA